MGFLTPLALLALGALSVPILIHLTQKDRREEIPFPTLMFLERIPYRAVRRQKIRHLLLFLLRAGAVALLVAAFTRPFFTTDAPLALASGAPLDRMVLLDRSMSMQEGDRWDRALDAARDAVRGVPVGGRAGLILFTDEAVVAAPLGSDPTLALSVLDTLSAQDRGTRLAPAFQAAASLLDDPERDREVVVVSDLQTSAWPEGGRYTLPEGVSVRTMAVTEGETPNPRLAGLRVVVDPPRGEAPGVVRVSALLQDAQALGAGAGVLLELDGEAVGRAALSRDGRISVPISLEGDLPTGSANAYGILRIDGVGSQGLSADDILHFVATPPDPLEVLVVDDSDDGEASLYLDRALSIGSSPAYVAERITTARLSPQLLRGVDVVLLNDVALPGGRQRQALEDFLAGGGGLIVALGPSAEGSWEDWDLFPVSGGDPVDLDEDRGARLTELVLDHPILEPFRGEGSGDFSRARFFRARDVTVRDTTTGVIASFPGGRPALLEKPLEAGRLLVWMSSMDDFWTDLPRQAVFLPFVHQSLQYAAGYRAPEYAVAVGSSPLRALAASGEESGEALTLRSPLGSSREYAPGEVLPSLDEVGFWTLTEGGEERLLAVNPDPGESDLSPLDPEALTRQVAGSVGTGTPGGGSDIRWTDEDREGRQSIWRILILAALLLLIAETAVTARSRARMT